MKQAVLNGSRVIPAEQTWSAIKPILKDFGITRVGEITGLDRVGIPVWIAVRPNARTLSVSQGKGLDDTAAKVSAAMEALEIAHAEQPQLPLRYATAGEIAISGDGDLVDLNALPRMRSSLFGTKRRVPWTTATIWNSGGAVWVPYEIVHADATVPRMEGAGSFMHSTNGLASGNTAEEAILHGLCELIERDALAVWQHAGSSAQAASRLDLESIEGSICGDIVGRFRSADLVPTVWDATSDVGIATFLVALYDDTSDPVTRPLPTCRGAGCHPDRTIALCRALTEAAQSRLTAIAGSRDDLGRPHYRDMQSAQALASSRDAAYGHAGRRPITAVPTLVTESVAADLNRVVAQLDQAGLTQILVVDLSRRGLPVSVARVIVPGLEGPTHSPSYLPGKRALANAAAGPA
jgi:YcaO-like protein with predicted kinase domain